jgi:G:T-mismatch repair DNA endonuclease (very short patch repair protein)
MVRDKKNVEDLIGLGWKVIIVWQCELKDVEKITDKLILELSK